MRVALDKCEDICWNIMYLHCSHLLLLSSSLSPSLFLLLLLYITCIILCLTEKWWENISMWL